ncbi:tachykinin-like peptides receptor 86C [Artemia franciscana]|uniref:tachykinin-like peptides receptor 86C n=1 Tax=Artemia franciscana TaxID=6661 RepID=UPI0032DBAE66
MNDYESIFNTSIWDDIRNGSGLGAELRLNESMALNEMSHKEQILWSVAFVGMLVIAILGNFLVVWVILANRSMRSVTNYFLLNLSFADLITSIFNCSITFVFVLKGNWVYGEAYCIFSNYVASSTVASGCFTLVVISVDRYIAIVRPLCNRMSKKTAGTVIAAIWASSCLLSIPSVLYSRTVDDKKLDGGTITQCYMQWPDGDPGVSWQDYLYNVGFLFITYLIPVSIMGFTYAKMCLILHSNGKGIGESTGSQIENIQAKKKIVRMFIILVAVFTICWLPYHIYFIYQYHDPEFLGTTYVKHVYLAVYWLAMSNAMINPLLYYAMNTRFRQHFKCLLSLGKLPEVSWNRENNMTLRYTKSVQYGPARILRYKCPNVEHRYVHSVGEDKVIYQFAVEKQKHSYSLHNLEQHEQLVA